MRNFLFSALIMSLQVHEMSNNAHGKTEQVFCMLVARNYYSNNVKRFFDSKIFFH